MTETPSPVWHPFTQHALQPKAPVVVRANGAYLETRDGRRIFPHTEVQPEYGGRGLATILVAEALDATRAAGLRIVPACSMVSGYIDKHPEYAPLVDPA